MTGRSAGSDERRRMLPRLRGCSRTGKMVKPSRDGGSEWTDSQISTQHTYLHNYLLTYVQGRSREILSRQKSTIPHEECWWGAHLLYLGLESVDGYITLVCDAYSQCDADLRLPSQLQDIAFAAPRLVPNYTAWWQRHMCVNNLPKVVIWQRLGREVNSRPLKSQANALTITPPGHTSRGIQNILCIFHHDS